MKFCNGVTFPCTGVNGVVGVGGVKLDIFGRLFCWLIDDEYIENEE